MTHRTKTDFALPILIGALGALLYAANVHAAAYTANVNNMNWDTAASWIPNGVPRAGDTATIPTGIRVNITDSTNVNIGAVTINGTGSLHVNSTAVISMDDFVNSTNVNIGAVTINGTGSLQIGRA